MRASAPVRVVVRGVNPADAVLHYSLELLVWLSAGVLIQTRAMLSELHANTLLVNTRQLWLLS